MRRFGCPFSFFRDPDGPLRLLVIAIAIALPAVLAAAEPAAWRVVSVHDGDTLTALDAAKDIATTCPHYVPGSFKVVGG